MLKASRREREIARTRGEILEAAARAFVRSGFEGATMQDIAREAGFTAASLYTYFKSKREIFNELLQTMIVEFQRTLDDPLPEGLTFRQKFELVTLRQMELCDQRRDMFVGFFTWNVPSDTEADSFGRQFHSNFERRIAALANWLRANASEADLGGRDPELAARLMAGIGFALMHRWAFEEPPVRFVEGVPLLLDLFLNGIHGKTNAPRRKGK